jgi:acyl-CoA reductase-like NAD-dependent aldehyde dehydrogenase
MQTPAPSKFTDDGRIQAINPLTWEVLAIVDPTPTSEIPGLIAACSEAQQEWVKRPIHQRTDALKRVLARVVERAEHLAEVVRKEHGKSTIEALASEVTDAASVLSTHIKRDAKWLKDTRVPIDPLIYPGKKGWIKRHPRGVLALITPWNYPIAIPMRTLVPALVAGNGVVFKPSEHSLLVGREIVALFEGILPAGLLQLVLGGGEQGAALTSSPGIDAISFTGSVRTGKRIAAAAAENLIPVSLELGGKDAAIVCADANLDRAVPALAFGAFHNSGQNCAGIERIYVESAIYDEFTKRLVAATEALRSSGDQPAVREVGPMCNQLQFDIVLRHLAEAKEAGGRILVGGEATGQGFTITPAVVVDAPSSCSLWSEETFGPVVPVARVDSVDEAIEAVNDSPYGLGATVFCGDRARGEAIAARLDVGMVVVNNSHLFMGSIPASPWCGVKHSGYGVTGSHLAMNFLTHPKLVVVDKKKQLEPWWFPFNDTYLELVRTNLRGLVAGGLAKLPILLKLLRLLSKRWAS